MVRDRTCEASICSLSETLARSSALSVSTSRRSAVAWVSENDGDAPPSAIDPPPPRDRKAVVGAAASPTTLDVARDGDCWDSLWIVDESRRACDVVRNGLADGGARGGPPVVRLAVAKRVVFDC